MGTGSEKGSWPHNQSYKCLPLLSPDPQPFEADANTMSRLYYLVLHCSIYFYVLSSQLFVRQANFVCSFNVLMALVAAVAASTCVRGRHFT